MSSFGSDNNINTTDEPTINNNTNNVSIDSNNDNNDNSNDDFKFEIGNKFPQQYENIQYNDNNHQDPPPRFGEFDDDHYRSRTIAPQINMYSNYDVDVGPQLYQPNMNIHENFSEIHSQKMLSMSNNQMDNNMQPFITKRPQQNIQQRPNSDNDVPIYQNMDLKNVKTCFHLSTKGGSEIQELMGQVLKVIFEKNEVKIDYIENKKNKYEFIGRVFTSQESHYNINIYKLKKEDKDGNKSVIEIKQTFGDDDFGYYDFEREVLEKLESQNIIVRKKENNDISDFGRSIIDSLTLDEDEEDEDDEIDDYENLENDILSNNENDKEFDHNLCEIMLETLCNENSFREEYMHDAYQLVCYLERDDNRSKNMIDYILKNESKKPIIENLIKAIKAKKIFCAFITLHVLEIIHILLKKKAIKPPKTLDNDIKQVRGTWQNQQTNDLGNFKVNVMKSIQIDKKCIDIVNLIPIN